MQVAIHLGVHLTDEDRLLGCLMLNKAKLAEQGIIIPDPGRYRKLIRNLLQALGKTMPKDEIQDTVIDAIIDEDEPERIILSDPGFLGVPGNIFGAGEFYPHAPGQTAKLHALFEQYDVSFYIGLRDPATFLPSIFHHAKTNDFKEFMSGVDPHSARWSRVIARIRQAVPGAPITVWCNEETPLIFPDIIGAMADQDNPRPMEGLDELPASLMQPGAGDRLRAYMDRHRISEEDERRYVIMAFLDKCALPEAIEEEIDLPGWTAEYVEALSVQYDHDLEQLHDMDDVTFMTLQ